MIIAGIETSCDETSVGFTRDEKILSNLVFSQDVIHGRFGGVVPELAGRAHLEKISPLFREAMTIASVSFKEIDAIGVTNSPGLKGSLIIGVSFAAGLGYALQKPVYFTNHIHAHLAASFPEKITFPAPGAGCFRRTHQSFLPEIPYGNCSSRKNARRCLRRSF